MSPEVCSLYIDILVKKYSILHFDKVEEWFYDSQEYIVGLETGIGNYMTRLLK